MNSRLRLYSDGGARGNPGPAAIGVLLCGPDDEPIQDHGETIGDATNNVAEYTAVLVGLEMAKRLGAREIVFSVDSQLVAFQLLGKYRVKTPHILELYKKVKESCKAFERVEFHHLPRTHEKIRHVDKLVNRALDGFAC